MTSPATREPARPDRPPQGAGQHVEVLASITSAMGRATGLETTLDTALDGVLQALDLEMGGIYLLDEDTGELRASRSRGVPAEYVREVARFNRGEAVLGTALDGEVPVVVADLSSAEQAREATRKLGIRSVAFVPLYARGRAVGVMPVGSFRVRDFGTDELRLLSAVGGMLGLAIDNERLAARSRRHLAEVRSLLEIDRAIGEDRALEDVLRVVADEAATLCAADTAVLLLEAEGETRVAGEHGRRAVQALATVPALGGQALSGVLREPEPLAVRLEAAGGHAALVGLHASAQRPLAILAVRDHEWDDEDLAHLSTLAQRAALAVVKARARDAEGRRSGQLAMLSAASEIAASTLDVRRLLDALARYIQRSFGYYSVALYLVDQEGRSVSLGGAAGAAATVMPKGHRLPFGKGIIGWVAEQGEYVLANDVRREPRFLRAKMDATLSELAVPVRLMGEVVAVINVESNRLDSFDEGDVVALDGIAAQVAFAIRNARLFEDKVRTVRNLEILQEITTVLNSDLDLDAVIERIARRCVEAVKAAQMGAVLLFDEDHLVVRSSFGYRDAAALAHVRLAFHEGLPGSVFVSGQGRFVRSAAGDYGAHGAAFRKAAGGAERKSALCVPISLPEQKLGVMLLESLTSPEAFAPSDLRFAGTLANQAAIAIGNALHLRRIIELDRQRQGYLSNVSHELRTPLTVTQGYLETLLGEGLASGAARHVEVALQNCYRLGRLIDEILEVSRLEEGVAQRHLQWAAVKVQDLVHRVVQFVRAEAAVKRLRVLEHLPEELPPMAGDERLLHMLVFHLVENAIKFTPEGGTVEVELELSGEELLARVRDTGIGIAPEHHERIFDKFYTVDSGSARSHGGTGIGLYLAREIVAIHDGAMSVESAPGQGASFEVRLPLRPQR